MKDRAIECDAVAPPPSAASIALHRAAAYAQRNRQTRDAAQKEWALETLAVSARLRGNREFWASCSAFFLPPATKRCARFTMRAAARLLPGVRVRGEGDPTSKDEEVNEAYDGAGVTYDLYRKRFKRKLDR